MSVRSRCVPSWASVVGVLTTVGPAAPLCAQTALPLITAAATGTTSGNGAYAWAPRGVPDGIAFDGSRMPAPPVINRLGEVAFAAALIGAVTPGVNDEALWAGLPQSTTLVARRGSQALGVPTGVLYDRLVPPPGAAGRQWVTLAPGVPRAAFLAQLRGTGVTPANNFACWGGPYIDKQLVARTGSTVPGVSPAATLSALNAAGARPPLIIDSGVAVVGAGWNGPGGPSDPRTGVLRSLFGVTTLAAATGQAVPGLTGATFGHLRPTGVSTGESILVSGLALGPDPGLVRAVDVTLAAGVGSLALASDQTTEPAPGSIGPTGRVALVRTLAGPTGPVTGLVTGLPPALRAVLVVGQAAPGAGPGVVIASIDPRTVTNRHGQTACRVTLQGPGITPASDTAVYLVSGGLVQTVARRGDPAPGFAGLAVGDVGTDLALNNNGQIALRTTLVGTNLPTNADAAWWLWTAAGGLALVSAEGLDVQVATGDFRRAVDLPSEGRWCSSDGGGPTFLSDTGQMVYAVQMTVGWVIGVTGLTPPSQVGACCIGSRCTLTQAGSCVGVNRVFSGPGTPCNAPGDASAPCCRGDFDHDGVRQPADLFAYLGAYFAARVSQADTDSSGTLEPADIFTFLGLYFAGGC
jgi:hypothetical protein